MTLVELNTLDLDFFSKEEVYRIVCKIAKCPNSTLIQINPSCLKGCHIKIYCNTKCDKCRLVFDSPKRFAEDLKRPEKCRNVLFDFKGKVSQWR
jgi:hypothetical protein